MGIQIFNEFEDVDMESVEGIRWHTLVGGGIANPYGPTILSCACNVEDLESTSADLYLLSIHPFSPKIQKVGLMTNPTEFNSNSIRELAGIFEGCSCPSMAFISSKFAEEPEVPLMKAFLEAFPDAEEHYKWIKRFPVGKEWDRAKAQMNGGLKERLQVTPKKGFFSFLRKKESPAQVPVHDEDWSEKMAAIYVDFKTRKAEQMFFFQAWDASVNHNPAAKMLRNLGPVIEMDEVLTKWFIPLFLSCRLPEEYWVGNKS